MLARCNLLCLLGLGVVLAGAEGLASPDEGTGEVWGVGAGVYTSVPAAEPFRGASQKLTAFLKANHDPAAPPDGLIHVAYEVELVHILELDEVRQTMTALLYIEERFSDATLAWDPARFGNLTETWLPEEDVWLPDVLIFNMVSHNNLLHSVRAPALVRHTGHVVYSHPAVYTVMCLIDIAEFPLDSQHCPLEVASWEYGSRKLVLDVATSHMLDHYKENEEWDLLHINTTATEYRHEDFTVSEIFFNIHIKRKPFFYVISLVLPSIIICSICIVGLFAPFSSTGEREEKFTLGVTALLTMAVLSLMVSEKVPHSSKTIPLLVKYFIYEMVVIMTATGTTGALLIVHRLDAKGAAPPPALVRRLFRIGLFNKSIAASPFTFSRCSSRHFPMLLLTWPLVQRRRAESERMVTDEVPDIRRRGAAPLSPTLLRHETPSLQGVVALLGTIWRTLEGIRAELGRLEDRCSRNGRQGLPDRDTKLWVQLAARLDHMFMAIFIALLYAPALYILVRGLGQQAETPV